MTAAPPIRVITVPGAELSCRCWASDTDAAPLLLLHALGEKASSWDPHAQAWCAQREVVALDLRGHGDSSWSESYSFEQLRDDVLAVIDGMERKPVIIGHSLGGIVGYFVASVASDRLTGLVLEDAPPPLPRVPRGSPPDGPIEGLDFDWRLMRDLPPLLTAADPAWWDALADISVPTLIVGGGGDSHVDQDQLRQMCEHIPNAQLATVGGGHDVHANEPEAFAAAVNAFLLSLD